MHRWRTHSKVSAIFALFTALSSLTVALPALAQAPVAVSPTGRDAETEGDLTIAVISDLNERYGDQFYRQTVHDAVARIASVEPDLVLVAGDMVAGQRPGLDYEGMWRAFDEAVIGPLDGIPVAIVAGNHDASSYERYTPERDLFVEEWRNGAPAASTAGLEMVDATDYPLRYSFAMGPAFFVALDATARGALAHGDQLDWLEEQLRSEAASSHPVRIVFGHFPLYPFAQDRERDYLLSDPAIRERAEQILSETGVALVISGHHHVFYPGRRAERPFRLLSAGCLGGGPRVLIGEDRVIEDLDDPTERSFAVIEIADGQIRSIDAYRGPRFAPDDRIDRETLPVRVGLSDLPIVRDDL